MKVLITGAHFTPAKAVIDELIKKPNVEIVYVGRKTVMEGDSAPSAESKELPKLKIKYRSIAAGRLRRSFDLLTIISLLKIPIGTIQSVYILFQERPDVILSFGGYVSVPVVFMAWLLSIPIITHEQGLELGLANKINSIFANKIALSFTRKDLKDKEIVTGNPLRREILNPVKKMSSDYERIFAKGQRSKTPVILVTGGNQGSHVINIAIEGCLQKLLKRVCIIHQTGESKYNDFEKLRKLQNDKYLVTKWIGDDFGAVLNKADLVICRSGMNTLAELASLGIPSLTIPIQNHSEQYNNAKYFQNAGLSQVMYQAQLTPRKLTEVIYDMLEKLPKLKQKANMSGKEIIPDGAERLALETMLINITS